MGLALVEMRTVEIELSEDENLAAACKGAGAAARVAAAPAVPRNLRRDMREMFMGFGGSINGRIGLMPRPGLKSEGQPLRLRSGQVRAAASHDSLLLSLQLEDEFQG